MRASYRARVSALQVARVFADLLRCGLRIGDISSRIAIVCVSFWVGCFWAHSAASAASAHPLSRAQVQTIEDLLASLRPEYQADLTFQVLQRDGDSFNAKQKRQLIQNVFDSSVNAVHPYATVDASHTQIGRAHLVELDLRSSKMDELDIQARAVASALPFNAQFAQQLFGSISVITPHGYSCDTSSVANVSAYYETAALLIRDSRLSTIEYNESRAAYLISLSQTMNAPVEIIPLAKLLTDARLSAADLELATTTFTTSLGSMSATDREMAVIEDSGQLTQEVDALASELRASGLSEAALIQAYRGFLIRGLSKSQCTDYSIDRHEVAQRFNALIAQHLGGYSSAVAPLTFKQLQPGMQSDAPAEPKIPVPTPIMPQIRRIVDLYHANLLQEYREGEPGTLQPENADMQAVLDYLMSSDSQGSSDPLCHFESNETTLTMLLSYLPSGDALNRTIDLSVNRLLANNELENDEPSEWIKMLRNLLNVSRTPDDKAKAFIADTIKRQYIPLLLPSPAAKEIERQLEESSDPVIHAYSTVEGLLPIPYQITNSM